MFYKKIFLTFFIVLCFSKASLAQKESINWVKVEDLQVLIKQNPKPILIDLYTNWCFYCKVLDAKTWKNRDVIRALNQYFHCVKFDAESKKTISFNKEKYNYLETGIHELALALSSKQTALSFPTLVFLDKNYEVTYRYSGYIKSKKIYPLLIYIGREEYRTKSWEEFMKVFSLESKKSKSRKK